MKKINPAEEYNKHRRIAFAIFTKNGLSKSLDYVEAIKSKLEYTSYIGLKEELFFYGVEGDKLQLTPTLDVGDCCDFTGKIGEEICRIDVTTNLSFKNLEKYEKLQKRGQKYFFALMDYKKNKLIDLIPINFKFCRCGGRLFDIVVLNQSEEIQGFSDNQKIVTICSKDPYSHYTIRKEEYNFLIPNFEAIIEEPSEHKRSNWHAISIVKFFKKTSQLNVVACGEDSYVAVATDGGGFWGTRIYWKLDLVSKDIDDIFETTLFDI